MGADPQASRDRRAGAVQPPVSRFDAQGLATLLGASFALAEARQHLHRTPAGILQKFQLSRFWRLA